MPVTIDDLFERMATRGTGAYGLSDVNQLEHALQAAALAAQRDMTPEMIIAALFHDVGHMFEDADVDLAAQGIDDKHEDASAAVLEPLFGAAVSEPVRLHVAAKRYLCGSDPAYYDKLADDSKTSLALQGGPMSGEELSAFEAGEFSRDGVALRIIDDEAKIPGLEVPSLESYRAIAMRVAGGNSAT